MKKTITSMILLFSLLISSPLVGGEFRNITVDGDPSDWSGIPPLVTDPQGDPTLSYPEEDIKAVHVAYDDDNLYFLMEMYPYPPDSIQIAYFFLIDSIPGEGDPNNAGADYFLEFIPGQLGGIGLGKHDTLGFECEGVQGGKTGFFIEVSVPWDCIGGKKCIQTTFRAQRAVFTDWAPDRDGETVVDVEFCPMEDAVGGELLASNTLLLRKIMMISTTAVLLLGVTKAKRKII